MAATEKNGNGKPPKAVVVEFEPVALGSRTVLFDLLKSGLGERKSGLSEAMFSRCGLCASPRHAAAKVAAELGMRSGAAATLAEKIEKGMAAHYASKNVALADGVEAFLKSALAQGCLIGALTTMPEDTARALIERLGLAPMGLRIASFAAESPSHPGGDIWLKAAKIVGCRARRTVAVADNANSCRSALVAGMRCIAVPDAFTSYQDFGGADAVVDRLADADLEAVLPVD